MGEGDKFLVISEVLNQLNYFESPMCTSLSTKFKSPLITLTLSIYAASRVHLLPAYILMDGNVFSHIRHPVHRVGPSPMMHWCLAARKNQTRKDLPTPLPSGLNSHPGLTASWMRRADIMPPSGSVSCSVFTHKHTHTHRHTHTHTHNMNTDTRTRTLTYEHRALTD